MTGLTRRQVLAGVGAAGAVATLGQVGTAQAASVRLAATRQAATVIVNGRVFTGTGRDRGARAVAVAADGSVLAVGSNSEVRRHKGRRTEVIDAGGGTVMAGIHDGHMHPLGAAEQAMSPSLQNASLTVPQLQAALQAMLDATADQEPDGWLHVTDWSPVGLLPAGTTADRAYLDALPTARPIYLQGSDFHNSFVNSRALELAGIDRDTPNPTGGEIVRDTNGDATGLLKDSAQGLVGSKIPPPTAAELEAAYVGMVGYLLSNGVTSFQDAACGERELSTYLSLMASNKLPQRVTPALVIDAELAASPGQATAYLARMRRRYDDHPRLRVTTAKVFMDGVIEYPAQTAALLAPYLDQDGHPTDNRGDLYVSRSVFSKLAARLDREGWQVHCHAIGDRATRVALDGFQAARHANGRTGNRHTITHLQLVHPDDYPRFARLGVLASMQLQWAVRNVWTLDALRPFIGRDRFRRLYPAGSLARHGAHLVGGSDWPVDPFAPFNQIATAVDRTAPAGEGSPRPLNKREGISRRQSLLMHTRGGAFQLGDRRSGRIAVGQRADLIVLDRDVTEGSLSSVRGAVVEHTLIGGKSVFDAGDASSTAAARVAGARQALTALLPAARSHGCCSVHPH